MEYRDTVLVNYLRLIFAIVLALAVGGEAQAVVKGKKKLKVIDIRGFGDGGFVGRSHDFVKPEEWAIEKNLLRLGALRSPHVNFVNMEGTIVRDCKKFATKRFAFVMAPEVLLSFARAGFNLFGLANNHSQDCLDPKPEEEYPKIHAFLKRMTPRTVWHGVAAEPEALWRNIPILTVRGVRIGFASIKAWENEADASVGNLTNRHQIFQALRDAKVDLRILSLHGGEENENEPTPLMMDIAREFVGLYDGDVVFGHHSHTIQGFEFVQKKSGRLGAIFYSLGNFLHDGLSHRGEGMMAQLKATKRGILPGSIRVYPLNSENELPGPASRKDLEFAKRVWQRSNETIARRTMPLGSKLSAIPFALQGVVTPAPGFRIRTGENMSPKPQPLAKSSR